MADRAGAGAEQPSQEELQAYLEQMRDADAAEIVAQAFQILAMGAEVKLGRSDARVLIDASAALVDVTGGRVPENLVTGMKNAVSQLQTAQVQSERAAAGGEPTSEPAANTAAGGGGGDGGTDSRTAGAPQAGTTPPPSESSQGSGQNMTDRLWIPGR